jgi:hypothetical protein
MPLSPLQFDNQGNESNLGMLAGRPERCGPSLDLSVGPPRLLASMIQQCVR